MYFRKEILRFVFNYYSGNKQSFSINKKKIDHSESIPHNGRNVEYPNIAFIAKIFEII